MEVLKLINVNKSYSMEKSSYQALKNISITINKGETIAVVGKSGSGKSTLLHILALLDKPSKGNVKLFGELTDDKTERQINNIRNHTFGFIFQQFFLNSEHTSLDNVTLPLKIAGVRKKERNERGMKSLEKVELANQWKSKSTNLSGGQKQRICIARAIANNPKIIFADEPTGNLDSVTGKVIEDLLFSLNEKYGITLIIVTHDNDLAHRCKRRINIKDGEIVGDSLNETK